MDQSEMVTLIRGGIERGGVWADLGAGTGNFTWALATLLGAGATIYAVDRDARAVAAIASRIVQAPLPARIVPLQGDFTQPLRLPPTDGVLTANALHFVRDQPAALARIVGWLKPEGRLLVVEYELHDAQRWVPYPLPFARLAALLAQVGLNALSLIGTRRSPSTGITLYAAVAQRQN